MLAIQTRNSRWDVGENTIVSDERKAMIDEEQRVYVWRTDGKE